MYDVGPYVTESLQSVIHQNGIRHQIVIVNDGSTDDGPAVVLGLLDERKHPHVLVVEQDNRGLSAARNTGLAFALGTYVAYLDTDDVMSPNAYVDVLAFANRNKLDAVFFRSLVLDDRDGIFHPFYDTEIWDNLLRGERRRITSAAQEPTSLRLEPNANTRVVRRRLIQELELYYPEGIYFEDLPVHIELLLGVRRFGLMDQALYGYRVGRPGKITEQRSRRRFDVLETFDLTVEVAKRHQASPVQGGEILASLLRITYWCGTMTSLEDRYEFFDQLCRRWSRIPHEWAVAYQERYRQALAEMVLVWAMEKRDAQFLVRTSLRQRPILGLIRFVVSKRRFAAVILQSLRVGRRLLGRATGAGRA
jgi:glycosyltransferase involved in cell wall biosynthesis